MPARGLDDLLDNLHEIEITSIESLKESLNQGAEAVKVAAEPLTPKDTGDLRSSARVLKVPANAVLWLRSKVRWGDSKAPYAAWVNAFPATFNYTTPGTGPKFAERALSLVASVLPKDMASRLGKTLVSKFPPTSRKGTATVTVKLNG